MNNILIIDDHQIVHEGLTNILQNNFIINRIYSAHTIVEVEEILEEQQFDLIFLDISIPHSNVFETINLIRSFDKSTKIIIFSMFDGRTYAYRLINAGADGYIEKKQPKIEIINAIKKVIDGKKYVSEDLMYNSISFVNAGNNPLSSLSNQELIILEYLVNGDTNNNIALKLNISPSTVSTVKRRICDKLHANTIIELIEIYQANN
jgi:two-component system, NarL family, invasion response regulator UvrY